MRRFLFLGGPLFFAALAFACEDDPTNNPTVEFPEAGTIDVNRPPPGDSGPPNDAAVDSPPAAPKGVTVIVTGLTGPKSGYTVVFHDQNGAVLETKQTGADGKASSAPTPTPAMATVALGGGFQKQLLTWTGVQDGDVLPAVVPEDEIAQVTVELPGLYDAGSAGAYTVRVGGCSFYQSDGTQPTLVNVYAGCYRGLGAVLVEAEDINAFPVGHAFKKPITVPVDGGAVTVNGLNPYVASTDAKVVLNATNANAVEGAVVTVHQIANNTYFRSPGSGYVMFDDVAMKYQRPYKAAPSTFVEAINASMWIPGQTFQSKLIVGKRVAPTPSIELDANTLPPEITTAAVDGTDAKRPSATWSGGMQGMKGGLIRMQYFNNSQETITNWTIVVPATGAQVKAPALPASLDDLLPAGEGGPTWEMAPQVMFADATVLPNYAAWRQIQGLIVPALTSDAQIQDAVIPQNGDFKITYWEQQIAR